MLAHVVLDDAARLFNGDGGGLRVKLGLGLVDHGLVGELVVEPELAEAAAEDAGLVAVDGRDVAGGFDLLADGFDLLELLDAAVDGDAVDAAEHLGSALLRTLGVGAAAVDALEVTGGVDGDELGLVHGLGLDRRLPAAALEGSDDLGGAEAGLGGGDDVRLPRAGLLAGVELLDGGSRGEGVLGDVEVELAEGPAVDDEALVLAVWHEGFVGAKVEDDVLLRVLGDVVLDDAAGGLDGGGALVGGELGCGGVDAALVGELTVQPELAEAAAEDAALVAVDGRDVTSLGDLLADAFELLGGLDAAVERDAVDTAEHLGAVLLLAHGVGAAAVDALEVTGGVDIDELLLGEELAELAAIADGSLPAAAFEGGAEIGDGDGVGHFSSRVLGERGNVPTRCVPVRRVAICRAGRKVRCNRCSLSRFHGRDKTHTRIARIVKADLAPTERLGTYS